MKNFSGFLKRLEKKHIITKKPHPIIPFILGIIILALIRISPSSFNPVLYVLAILTFIFAILHWIVVKVLEKK